MKPICHLTHAELATKVTYIFFRHSHSLQSDSPRSLLNKPTSVVLSQIMFLILRILRQKCLIFSIVEKVEIGAVYFSDDDPSGSDILSSKGMGSKTD